MKRCPKCQREFDDDLRFCLEDGTELVAGGLARTEAPQTAVMPAAGSAQPTLSQVAPPDVPEVFGRARAANTSPGKADPTHTSNPPIASGTAIVIGIILVVGLLLSFIGFSSWGTMFGRRVPMILLCLAGMAVAALRSGKHPTASLLVGLSLGLYIFKSFVFTGFNANLEEWMRILQIRYFTLYIMASFVDSIVYGIVIALMVSAVFVGRPRRS
jgi:hypothetical protein